MKNNKTNKAAKNTVKKTGKGAGKGDEPRSCYSKEFKENFQKIDWSKKKLVLADQNKVYLYPDHLNELIRCLLGQKDLSLEEYLVTDESTVGDFISEKDLKRLVKLKNKHIPKDIKLNDFIWKVAETMRGVRPF
jgi:hypothetical protein